MKISIIVATANNRVIGNSTTNSMPWHLSADLKNFKKITMGNSIIMGRKTFESLPNGKPLPGRLNIIISRDLDFRNSINAEGIALAFESLELAVSYLNFHKNHNEVFIIGGAQIYQEALTKLKVDFIYETLLDIDVEGDIQFPEISTTSWELKSSTDWNMENDIPYSFSVLTKK